MPDTTPKHIAAPGRLDASVTAVPGPVRLLALSDAAERRAIEVRDRHRGSRIEVVRV
ncbi:hypothetical protein [Dactylosporangium sp. NPDC048998]|uniref:hypothetical protein n=1 Tax=Dactylosporangium sp. NPDC048998 TaxID=3363976 RepID=UPI0037206342